MEASLINLANVIQIAVAPVFLLAGIAGFLNVMSGRLGRIVDRARILEKRMFVIKGEEQKKSSQYELRTLWRRIRMINWSIGMCTASALMVCAVVVSLFIGDIWHLQFETLVTGLFVFAMLLLITALILFLREIQLATRTLQLGRESFDD